MPVTFTPRQLRERSEFYYQLGQLTAAGIGLPAALQRLGQAPPGRSYRVPVTRLGDMLGEGCSFTESIQQLGSWLPVFDTALLKAGEQSGKLDACFRLLADYYQERARLARQLIADLLYPAFLFHFAILIFAFIAWFRSAPWTTLAAQTLGVLVPLYLLVALIIYAGQSRHGEKWRSFTEKLLHPVPVLGTARQYLALGRLAAALEALLSAGVTIVEAWELAARASGSPTLKRAVLGWRPLVDAGETPGEVLTASGRFPELFANQYVTAEVSGKLDETLGRLRQFYQEEGSRKLHLVTQWAPRAVYIVVMLLIAYWIVQFYAGYFNQINNLGL